MDEIAQYNIARWKALAQADALFTRPDLDLDVSSARQKIDNEKSLPILYIERYVTYK